MPGFKRDKWKKNHNRVKEIALNILDLAQNSIRAKAHEITIGIRESVANDIYRVGITDDGIGMDEDLMKSVSDPFVTTRTRRKMGLGLPLIKYHAELTGGGMKIRSERGKGTEVITSFSFSHIDRQPLGDITGVLRILIAANPGINFNYTHITDKGKYIFSSVETKEYLGEMNLSDPELLDDIIEIIQENLKMIEASGIAFREKVGKNI
jgi:DNA mismatch repair ATPase MutL